MCVMDCAQGQREARHLRENNCCRYGVAHSCSPPLPPLPPVPFWPSSAKGAKRVPKRTHFVVCRVETTLLGPSHGSPIERPPGPPKPACLPTSIASTPASHYLRNLLPQTYCCCCYNIAESIQVGAYAGLVKERFERCLDLYLCPRAFKRRLNIDPESLVPRLPRPRELKPFPNALCVEYRGHAASVRCIACSGDGQWMATGDDNGVLILWEV